MKGGLKNALPWAVLLTLVLISAGVSMTVSEGFKEGNHTKKHNSK